MYIYYFYLPTLTVENNCNSTKILNNIDLLDEI